jgi:hypothetical protein
MKIKTGLAIGMMAVNEQSGETKSGNSIRYPNEQAHHCCQAVCAAKESIPFNRFVIRRLFTRRWPVRFIRGLECDGDFPGTFAGILSTGASGHAGTETGAGDLSAGDPVTAA